MADTRYPVRRDTADLLAHPDDGLTEAQRQAEIRDLPVGGSSSAYCAIGFSGASYTLPGSPVSSYGQAFPFDTEVVNVGGFNVNYTYDTGAAIAPTLDGWYRIGLTGTGAWTFDPAGGAAPPSAFATEASYHYFEIFGFPSVGPGHFHVLQRLDWGRITDGVHAWVPLMEDSLIALNLVSGPIQLRAGDFVEPTFNPTDAATISTLLLDGEAAVGNRCATRFWIEAL